MKSKGTLAAGLAFIFFASASGFCLEDVSDPTHTKVAVMKHPKTGKPYVALLPENEMPEDALVFPAAGAAGGPGKSVSRPDYRMLDWKIKSGEIPYDGPVSDRKKVYILAATLATIGVASGTAAAFAIPATATTASTAGGGAGVYAAAGTALTAGTVSTALIQSRPDPKQDDFDHISQSKTAGISNT